ncbi:MAG: DUF5777 family beta-barrel protein [Bryobacteraceae bacterium]
MRSEKKLMGIVFALLAAYLFLSGSNASALPQFLVRFSQDPFSRPEYRNKCSTCHINPKGSGPRNPFGTAFERNKHIVTPEFRRAWPDHFLPSLTSNPVPTRQGEMKATILADGENTILEIDGQRYRLNTKLARLEKIEPEEVAKLTAAPPPPAPAEPKLPLRDQPTFDHYLVNLPTTLPYERGAFSLRFSHRFEQGVLNCGQNCAGIGELYGLDSYSLSSFGGELGITGRLAATVYRSPVNKTIEMGGVFQLLRQKGKEPLSASLRVTVEGRDNFHDYYTTNLVLPVSRSISNVAEVFVDPMISFNANPFARPAAPSVPLGVTRANQAAVGFGASIRFRPRTAFVMEWSPRVSGYHAVGSRNTYSFGLLRSTNAHVFELVLSNTVATTTSQAVSFGLDQLSLGFNIYRRIR